jgi:iduronate 2-sulfatase
MPGSKKPATLNRRSFLATGALAAPLAASAFAASAPAAPRGNKRNVLFLCCDDLTPRIGSFGDPVAKTPNLDRLSALGVRFERNYCQYPLCGPSRDSLMTGLAPDTTRIYDLNTDFRDIHPNAVTLPQLFHRNGYFTARAGKIYHYNNPSEIGTPGFDDAASWEVSTFPAGFDRTHDEGLVNIYVSASTITQARKGAEESQTPSAAQAPGTPSFQHGGRGPGGARLAQDGRTPILPLGMHGDLGIPIAAHPSEAPDELITDYMIAESAIAMIEEQHGEHPDQPWFIAAGFFRPHVPFIVPSKYFDLYALEDMQPPAVAPGELSQAPPLAYLTTEANYGRPGWPPAGRRGPARPAGKHHHRLLVRSRLHGRRARPMGKAHAF